MAVKLTGGDPFLLQVEPGAAGPLAAYKEGRLRGMYRKVRGAAARVGLIEEPSAACHCSSSYALLPAVDAWLGTMRCCRRSALF